MVFADELAQVTYFFLLEVLGGKVLTEVNLFVLEHVFFVVQKLNLDLAETALI